MLRPQWPRHLIDPFPPKLKLFTASQSSLTRPPNSLSSLLALCKIPRHLQQIHARFILHGLHQNTALATKLIDAYSNLGHLGISKQVFYSISDPTTTLYSTFLGCLCKFGEHKQALSVYQEMALKSMYPDEVAYPLLLRSSSQLLENETGKKIHGHVLKLGFDLSETVRCAFDDGNDRQLFEKMTAKGSVYWSSLIFEPCLDGDLEKSFHIFNRMRMERMELEPVTVINLLRATVDLGLLKVGRCIHSLIVVSSLCEDIAVSTALLTMYSKLRSVEDAGLLFDRMPERDSVVWNLMISAYSRNGYPKDSLDLLMRMVRSGVRTDLFTAIPAISSVAELKSLEWGKQIHAHAIRNGSDYQR